MYGGRGGEVGAWRNSTLVPRTGRLSDDKEFEGGLNVGEMLKMRKYVISKCFDISSVRKNNEIT